RARVYVKRRMSGDGIRVIGEADNTQTGLRLVRGLQPDCVLIELEPTASLTLETVKKIREELPDTGIILSSHESSPQLILSCIRAGAQEFVSRPIDAGELEKAFDHMRKLLARNGGNGKKRGKILSAFSGKGGIGATSVVANLGVALAEQSNAKTVLVDLCFHMGDLCLMLDQTPRYSLVDAMSDGSVDSGKLPSVLCQHESGVYVLTVAASPEMADEINTAHMTELFGMLGSMFDYVIVDVGRHLDDRTVEVLSLSDGILFLSALDLPTIRNVKRYLDIFDELEIDRSLIHLVVNRFQKKSRLTLTDLENTVGLETFWAVPNDFAPISLGIDRGNPAVLEAPKSKVAQNFKDLAECVCELYGREESVGSMETATG
ncbi:MAG: response regulator, partial [Candidatus Latescibacterota bacterium]